MENLRTNKIAKGKSWQVTIIIISILPIIKGLVKDLNKNYNSVSAFIGFGILHVLFITSSFYSFVKNLNKLMQEKFEEKNIYPKI